MSVGPLIPADEPKPRPSEGFFKRLRNKVLNTVEVFVILAMLSFIAGLLGEFHFLLDLTSHFRIQAGVVTLVGGLILLVFRGLRFSLLACVTGAALLLSTYPYFLPTAAPSADAETQRMLLLNVLQDNPQKQKVIDYLVAQDADVIMLLETDQAWADAVSPAIAETWPYQKTIPRDDHFGLCFYSKRPWASARQFNLTETRVPGVDVRFNAGPDQPFGYRLIGTHAMAPLDSGRWRGRNEQFEAIARMVQEGRADQTLLIGDLNCTPWSPNFREFVKQSALRDAAHGRQLKFTWWAFQLPLCGLPIDQVMIGDDVLVKSHRVSPRVGSDHRAVVVDFAVDK